MIIYGVKAVHLQSKQSQYKCASCATEDSVLLSVYRKHAHVFWVPMFPLNKKVYSQCQHCKVVLEEVQMSEKQKKECVELKKESSGRFWQWTGAILFFVLFGHSILTLIIYAITGEM